MSAFERKVYDAQGQLYLSEQLLPDAELDISSLTAGVYLYVIDVDGKLETGRFVKL